MKNIEIFEGVFGALNVMKSANQIRSSALKCVVCIDVLCMFEID